MMPDKISGCKEHAMNNEKYPEQHPGCRTSRRGRHPPPDGNRIPTGRSFPPGDNSSAHSPEPRKLPSGLPPASVQTDEADAGKKQKSIGNTVGASSVFESVSECFHEKILSPLKKTDSQSIITKFGG